MRTFDFSRFKCGKKHILAYGICVILAIIFGIVLCKITQISIYFQNYASEYLYYVFNFKNGSLLFPKLLYEIVYGYVFFLIARFTRFKFLSLPVLFLKCLLNSVYAVILISSGAFGGTIVAVFVFIPSALVSAALNIFLVENCKKFNKRWAPAMPALFAVADTLLLIVLVNILFRVIISIV